MPDIESDLYEVIPQAMKRVRLQTGLRQIDVCNKSGLSKAMVSAYEAGKALPSVPSLIAFLNAMGQDLSDLQVAIDEICGIPSHLPSRDAKERAVGRAILRALHGINLDDIEDLTP